MNLKLSLYLPYTPDHYSSYLHSPQWPVTAAITENRHSPNRPSSVCGVSAEQKCQNCHCSCHSEVNLCFRVFSPKMVRFRCFKNCYRPNNICLNHFNSCFCSILSINDDITAAKRRRHCSCHCDVCFLCS